MAKKIIAVFGPSGPNTFSVTASSLGEPIAANNILLTGGTGIPDSRSRNRPSSGPSAPSAPGQPEGGSVCRKPAAERYPLFPGTDLS